MMSDKSIRRCLPGPVGRTDGAERTGSHLGGGCSLLKRIPSPIHRWPPAAQRAAACRAPSDFGVGDTAARAGTTRTLCRVLEGQEPAEMWLNYRFPYQLPETIAITLSANGIGDAACALYAACGLARVVDRPVELVTKWRDWFAEVETPGVKLVGRSDGQCINANWDYQRQVKDAPSRKQDYCNALADALFLSPFTPIAPTARPFTPLPVRYPPHLRPFVSHSRPEYIILAPFSEGPGRVWPHWRQLAERLAERRYMVIGIGAAKDREAMEGICGGIVGASPGAVMRMLAGARCIVANDSAPAHLGGLLGVPTVCVHAGCLPHDFLFNLAPSVRSVTPGIACERGEDSRPDLLELVGVDAVMEAITDGN